MTTTDQDTLELGFCGSVRDAFSYLSEFGFEESSSGTLSVQGSDCGVEVTFAKLDWEIAVFYVRFEFALDISITHAGRNYSLFELISALDPENARNFRQITASNAREASLGLKALSEQLKKYGKDALVGDPHIVTMLENARQEFQRKM